MMGKRKGRTSRRRVNKIERPEWVKLGKGSLPSSPGPFKEGNGLSEGSLGKRLRKRFLHS